MWLMNGTPAPRRDQETSPLSLRRAERRKSTWHALWSSSFERRRQGLRRYADRGLVITDWHHPQWLAVSLLILLLCCADALLTLTLVNSGASEINPFMQPLVTGAGHGFVLWKFGLTSTGVVMLVIIAQHRAFGSWRVGRLLYLVLFGYCALVGYELWLAQGLIDLGELLPLE
jgi:hypothetical protein